MPKKKSDAVNYNIGQKLKKYRIACGLTQEQVASLLNINRTTYTKYETGVSEPSHDILRQIVAIYKIDFNTIFVDDDLFERNVADSGVPILTLSEEEKKIVNIFRTLPRSKKKEFLETLHKMFLHT